MRRGELILVLAAGCHCTSPTVWAPASSTGDSSTGWSTPAQTGETGERLAWVMLDAGYEVACGVLNDGRTMCWGNWGQAPLAPYVQISVDVGGCGLTEYGRIVCWCPRDSDDPDACDRVPTDDGFVRVEFAEFWACAETTDRHLECWGRHNRAATGPTGPVYHWAIESNFGCAVLDDGHVTCWGPGTANFAWADPTPEPPPERKYVQVAAGRNHACALDTEGEIQCWGSTQVRTEFPAAPPGPWVSVVAWNSFTCGLRADGEGECWFDLGGDLPNWELPDERWAQIGLGEWDACGLTLDGRGVCWGQVDSAGEHQVPDLADL